MIFRRVVLCAAMMLVTGGLGAGIQAQRVISTDVNKVVLGFMIECYGCEVSTANRDTSYVYKNPPIVIGISKDGPAMSAGLKQGDILTHINGVSITTPDGGRLLANAQAGKELTLTVRRGGQPSQLRLTPKATEAQPTPLDEWYVSAPRGFWTSSAGGTRWVPERTMEVDWIRQKPFEIRADSFIYRGYEPKAAGSAAAGAGRTAGKQFTATFAGIELSIEGNKPVKVTVVEPDCLFSIEVDGTIILLRSADRCK